MKMTDANGLYEIALEEETFALLQQQQKEHHQNNWEEEKGDNKIEGVEKKIFKAKTELSHSIFHKFIQQNLMLFVVTFEFKQDQILFPPSNHQMINLQDRYPNALVKRRLLKLMGKQKRRSKS